MPRVPVKDFGSDTPVLSPLEPERLTQLPADAEPRAPMPPRDAWLEKYDFSLDGFSALGLPLPKTAEEEERIVSGFLRGLAKLFTRENNWAFLLPTALSTDYCMRCNTCNAACGVYEASGRQDVYRPNFRSELLRRIYRRYFSPQGKLLGKWTGAPELNWRVVYRLAELAYRCTLCRRCAGVCPVGVDNGLLCRELRKLFSMEMGIAPAALHKSGTVRHLATGAGTGMKPAAFLDNLEFIEEIIEEKTGKRIRIPVDKKGAEILLVHNSGEYLSWPENPAAFAIVFDAAGIDWTLSSASMGYEAVNYGLWYDDVQYARIAMAQVEAARRLGVKKIVVGECGHATKAIVTIADRLLSGDLRIPRESCLPLLEEIVAGGRVRLDPWRNDFPVTLHDPCNMVRLMGIVSPQRNILTRILPPGRFREMPSNGTENYCCGGGSGFAIMDAYNFPEWRNRVASRKKAQQVLTAFGDCLDPSVPKYYCAPCSNCKGAAREALMDCYRFRERYNILYGGLVELIANAMAELPGPFLSWETEF
ncbi:MAG: (Fe-S)-binding protein [Pirellulales bacterium]|nr:(Fe-S)-binding protein [Pirellulales bacterium]